MATTDNKVKQIFDPQNWLYIYNFTQVFLLKFIWLQSILVKYGRVNNSPTDSASGHVTIEEMFALFNAPVPLKVQVHTIAHLKARIMYNFETRW